MDFRLANASKNKVSTRGRMGRPPDPNKLSSTEASRKHKDAYASIDEELDEALSKINWERRNNAEADIITWIKTYCIGVFLDEPPSPIGELIIREMYECVCNNALVRPYMICMARGGGKTSYTECLLMYVMSTGKSKFPVIISNNVDAARNILNDTFRIIMDPDTPFSQDYPNVCLPFQITNGSFRRRQTYKGRTTDIVKNTSMICFARLFKEDGTEFNTSGSCIYTRGITSGLRGMKRNTLRPTLVLLDDIQDSESASSEEQVGKLLDIINKDVMNLGGKGKIAVLQTATPICDGDLVQRIREDKNWKVTVWPAIIEWPKDMVDKPDSGMWHRYFQMYDAENSKDGNHEKSLKFYEKHQKSMDKGARVMNPNRFLKSDGHISALQALLEKRHIIGESAFSSEYQMSVKQVSIEVSITPKDVVSKINQDVERLQIPDGYTWSSLTVDLNTSYGLTASISAYKKDSTSVVLYHHVNKLRIDQSLNEVEYTKAVYSALTANINDILSKGLRPSRIGIDCGGRNWNAVCTWCKNSIQLCGVPAVAMAGRNSTQFNPLSRSRLRNAIDRVVLCGDAREQLKSGAGNKWLYFDSDYYREQVQRSFLGDFGSIGGCTLYNELPVNHIDFATQVCNEKLQWKKTKSNGVIEYHWKSKEPHDFLDTMAMSRALSAHEGLSSDNVIHTTISQQRRNILRRPVRNRFRVI